MKELLEYMLENLVENPDKLTIDEETEQMTGNIIYTIDGDDNDKGRIIGKSGRNIKSIRSILNILARRQNIKVFLRVE